MVINMSGAAMPYIIADAVAPSVTTTASTATQVVDWSAAQIFPFLLGNNTVFQFANAIVGETITLVLTQNGTGSMTGTFPTGCIFPGGTKTLSTSANYVDTVKITCIGAAQFLCTLAVHYS